MQCGLITTTIIIIIHVSAKLARAVSSSEHDEPRASAFFDRWSGRLFLGFRLTFSELTVGATDGGVNLAYIKVW